MTVFNFNAGTAIAIQTGNNASSIAPPVSLDTYKQEFIEERRQKLEELNKKKETLLRRGIKLS